MPIHRLSHPSRPQHPAPANVLLAPLVTTVPIAALAAVTALASFGWTNTYYPDGFPGRVRPGTRLSAGPNSGCLTDNNGADRRGADDAEIRLTATHNVDGHDGAAHHGRDAAEYLAADPYGVEDEETANARRFVAIALDGGFGEAHRQAAQIGLAVAIDHGFGDDAKRVAEALVVFLAPEYR